MTPNTTTRHPILNSPTTRQFAEHITALIRRDASIDETITAIRAGNNTVLQRLVQQAQCGDTDAAIVAIWALHPRLCAVVIRRHPVQDWAATIDDYIALAYLAINDVEPTESAKYLADKIIARTRRRHERANEADDALPCEDYILNALRTRASDDVENRVLAHLELEDLLRAIAGGLLTPAAWQNLIGLRIGGSPDRPATELERSSLKRAKRRLDDWRTEAA